MSSLEFKNDKLKIITESPRGQWLQDSAPASAGATRIAVPSGIILCMRPVDERYDVTA